MNLIIILSICLFNIIFLLIGYRIGKDVRVFEVKTNQEVRELKSKREPRYEEEDAFVPGEDDDK